MDELFYIYGIAILLLYSFFVGIRFIAYKDETPTDKKSVRVTWAIWFALVPIAVLPHLGKLIPILTRPIHCVIYYGAVILVWALNSYSFFSAYKILTTSKNYDEQVARMRKWKNYSKRCIEFNFSCIIILIVSFLRDSYQVLR